MSGIILTSYHIDIELEKQIKYYQDYWTQKKESI